MFRIIQTLTRLPYISTPVIKSHSYQPLRCQATFPLFPPGVEISEDPDDESYDIVKIGEEKFRRKISYFSWLCLPKPEMDEILYEKQHKLLLEWRTLTQYTKPPVYPDLDFYKEWFDLMIRCDMYQEMRHFYTLHNDMQFNLVFDEELTDKIELYLADARARSYHNWERM
ncbi:hypothetical protein LOD99_12948 [Oopsacas minuta]|uniref:Uncharacterized protein n=1 Tax=Oopsacas minuta TaxID=111878 RepID=A0AAV7JA80_9METZ|nr:hypothetical protein LOD99_12948 [Oopsacas minuta]